MCKKYAATSRHYQVKSRRKALIQTSISEIAVKQQHARECSCVVVETSISEIAVKQQHFALRGGFAWQTSISEIAVKQQRRLLEGRPRFQTSISEIAVKQQPHSALPENEIETSISEIAVKQQRSPGQPVLFPETSISEIAVKQQRNSRLERGASVNRTIQFPAYDFLRLTGRGTGKQAYELFMSALDRLQSTTIRTTITSGQNEERERRGFSWIDSYRIVERINSRGQRVMAAVELTLNKWMFRAIVENRRVLTIDRGYFRLKMGLERRLYELARKHCGRQPIWKISLPRLAEKCGSEMELRNFKVYLKKISEADSLPQYRVGLAFDKSDPEQQRMNEDLGSNAWR